MNMKLESTKKIEQFIRDIHTKNYAAAKDDLQHIVNEKLKEKIRNFSK